MDINVNGNVNGNMNVISLDFEVDWPYNLQEQPISVALIKSDAKTTYTLKLQSILLLPQSIPVQYDQIEAAG